MEEQVLEKDPGKDLEKDSRKESGQGPSQQPQVNPIAQLLEWSNRKSTYALSVLLAIIGVAGGMVPYFAAGNMVIGIFNGVRDWSFYLQWGLVAAISYVVQIVFHHLSTTASHVATFATIADLRVRLAQKLTRVPMDTHACREGGQHRDHACSCGARTYL